MRVMTTVHCVSPFFSPSSSRSVDTQYNTDTSLGNNIVYRHIGRGHFSSGRSFPSHRRRIQQRERGPPGPENPARRLC